MDRLTYKGDEGESSENQDKKVCKIGALENAERTAQGTGHLDASWSYPSV